MLPIQLIGWTEIGREFIRANTRRPSTLNGEAGFIGLCIEIKIDDRRQAGRHHCGLRYSASRPDDRQIRAAASMVFIRQQFFYFRVGHTAAAVENHKSYNAAPVANNFIVMPLVTHIHKWNRPQ